MRFLVTGHKGYIGRFIEMELALRYGHKNVEGLDVSPDTEVASEKGFWGCYFAFRSPVDVVLHIGANSKAWYDNPDIYFWNYESTKEIVRYCMKHNARLIYFSSAAAIAPVNHYGWSKRTSSDYIKSNLEDYAILNPYQVYGKEYGRPSGYSVPVRILRGELDSIFDPWVRDYLHIDDLIQMVMKVIDDNLAGEFDLGRGIRVSNRDLFEWAHIKDLPVVGPGHEDYPDGAHAEIVARKDHLVPDIKPDHDVRVYVYYNRGLKRCE